MKHLIIHRINLKYNKMVSTFLKRWGNSLAVIIPQEEIKEKNLSENDKIQIEIFKEADFSDVFGNLKTNITGQEFKKEVKRGWK